MTIPAIKPYLICVAVSLVAGFIVGYDTKGRFVDAAHMEALSDARKQDVSIVADSARRDERLLAAIQETTNFFAFRQKEFEALTHLTEQIPNNVNSSNQQALICPDDPVLSNDLVRLLNSNP